VILEGGVFVIIIAGHSRASNAIERDAAVAVFADMVARARQQDGCLDFSIGADQVDPERINVFECWRDQLSLNAWRKIARGPKVALKGAQVKLYRAEKAEKPFRGRLPLEVPRIRPGASASRQARWSRVRLGCP
jgi:quinol monooxygenase YgiN